MTLNHLLEIVPATTTTPLFWFYFPLVVFERKWHGTTKHQFYTYHHEYCYLPEKSSFYPQSSESLPSPDYSKLEHENVHRQYTGVRDDWRGWGGGGLKVLKVPRASKQNPTNPICVLKALLKSLEFIFKIYLFKKVTQWRFQKQEFKICLRQAM